MHLTGCIEKSPLTTYRRFDCGSECGNATKLHFASNSIQYTNLFSADEIVEFQLAGNAEGPQQPTCLEGNCTT